MRIVFFIGRPNSGKSTQAALVQRAIVLSPGQWLRENSAAHATSDLGAFIFHNWSNEALTPLVIEHLDARLGELASGQDAAVVAVDGFPRNVAEVHALPRLCRGHPFVVVEFAPHEDVIRERGLQRQRGSDDSACALDIRLEAYTANAGEIREALAALSAAPLYVRLETVADDVPAAIAARVEHVVDQQLHRVPIPPHRPRRHLARRHFVEANAIDGAAIVQKCLRLARSTRLRRQFFGTHPISFTRVNIPRIRRYPYLVSLKATGVRYMALVFGGRIWLVSRKLDVFMMTQRIDALVAFDETLLDGELIGEEEAAYYVVLDCLAAAGVNCMRDHIMERLRRSVAVGKIMYHGPLHFRPQEYVDRSQLAMLLRRAKDLPWAIDGVILQPARLPYRLGIDFNMFKWKPLAENSADFYYCEDDGGLYCRASSGEPRRDGSPTPINTERARRISGGDKHTDLVRFGRLIPALRPPWLRGGMIIECIPLQAEAVESLLAEIERENWDTNELVWVPQQHRSDKLAPNIDWVAQSVIQSIIDNVTQEELETQCAAASISGANLPRETAVLIPHAAPSRKRPKSYK